VDTCACGHRLDRKTHGLSPSGVCMQAYARVHNADGAVMVTAQNRRRVHDNRTRKGGMTSGGAHAQTAAAPAKRPAWLDG
jgi:hypothetical protein